jgi:enterochelin esterase-like enzyme
MKKILSISLLCILLTPILALAEIWSPTPLDYPSKNFYQGEYESLVTGTKKTFIVRLPKKYVTGAPVDVVYFLPGGAGFATGMPENFKDLGHYLNDSLFDNALFVAPDAGNYGMWSDSQKFKNTQVVLELIKYIESNVPHTDSRILMGHSLGGAGAMHFAFDYPEMFDGIASISPAIFWWSPFEVSDDEIRSYVRDYAPKQTFEYFKKSVEAVKFSFASPEAWTQYDFYHRIQTKNLPTCYAIFTGDQDPLGFHHHSREFIKKANSYGKKIFYREEAGREHDIGKAILDAMSFVRSCKK